MAIDRHKVGRHRSQPVVLGDRVYLAGQVAEQAAGEPVATQTREILARIDRLLAEVGTSKARLRAAHIRLTDMGAFAEMNGVWNGWMVDGPAHERTTVEAALASSGQDIEIAIVAAR